MSIYESENDTRQGTLNLILLLIPSSEIVESFIFNFPVNSIKPVFMSPFA